jgi:hypothetical protein
MGQTQIGGRHRPPPLELTLELRLVRLSAILGQPSTRLRDLAMAAGFA